MNPVIVKDALNYLSCPLCNAADGQFVRRGYYVKCSKCQVAFREEQESAGALEAYWQEGFWTEEEIKRRKNREPVFRDAFELLHEQRSEGGSVLDIGCGIGTFLALCRDGGWNVTGVEPSSIACEVAAREYGIEPINESFSSTRFRGKKFDVIFAAQVLHHLPDPVGFLKDIDRVLADDGILMLRTPNLIPLEFSLLLQHLLGRKKEFFCGPALYAFHPNTLSLLFRQLGYRQVTFVNSRPYIEMPRGSWKPGQYFGKNLWRLLVTAIKVGTYGAVQATSTVSKGRVVIGPSIFVLARK